MGCKCCQSYESLVYLHYFTRQIRKYVRNRQANAQFEKKHNAWDHSSKY